MRTQLALVGALVCVVAVMFAVSRTVSRSLEVAADDEGWFVGTGVAGSPVYPGEGVSLAVIDATTGAVAGRLDRKAESPSVWQRTTDGKLDARPLRTVKSDAPRAAEVRALAVASLVLTPGSSTSAAFAECCGRETDAVASQQRDASDPLSASTHSSADPAETPLADWAPVECLFVRFRSVEAAYRFASAFDQLAGALHAAYGEDARDYGTLRLALHDLLLPTIWRTNPEAERGVGEVGLVIAPPFVRGRLEVAVLMRITDGELHRMQTVAGIAQERAPDHLWRPADDPFPAERDRINFRENPDGAPRIEVVATSEALGRRIVSRKSAVVEEDGRYRELRSATLGPDGAPVPGEAAFLYSWLAVEPFVRSYFPGVLRTTAREEREGLGVRWLAEKWLGTAKRAVTIDERSRGPAILASIESVRITTDEKGAHVGATFTDADAATRAAGALSMLGSAGAAAGRACARNLADLVPLALVEKPHDIAERAFVVLGWKPVCPCRGEYSVHPVTREVSCSAHGRIGALKDAKFTPPPISDVAAEGTSLSFRLAIDWNRRE